jgi:ketosteroid isomerase-like protein
MSNREENLEIAAAAFDAFERGDIEGLLATADSDVEIYIPATLPNSGTYRGHAGYLQMVAQWLEAWEEFGIDVVSMTPVGDRHVVTDTRQRAVGRGSGIEVEQDMIYMAEVCDGYFTALHIYSTHEEAVAVAQDREAADR